MIDLIYRKDENYYYYFIEDINFFCSNSTEDYYDKQCINLFLKTLNNKKKNIRNFFKFGTLKFPPKIQEFFKLGARKFHFPKHFFRAGFFFFFELRNILPEI